MRDIDAGPDLARALDESYGDGPAHRPIEPVLRTGRRVRRRRQVLGGSAAVMAAVAALFTVTAAADLVSGDEGQVVARPSATALPSSTPSRPSTPSPTPSPAASSEPEVAFGPGERLRARPPTVILTQIADVELGPRFAGPDDRTAAAEVRWQGERWYVLAREIDGGPAEYFPEAATRSTPTLPDFLADAEERYGDGTGLR